MQLADTQPAGEVVRPHRGAEQASEPAGQETVSGEHRQEEREHADEVRGGLAEHLALGQRFVHEADLALLEIPDPAVHELRRLRRSSRCEVVTFDERGAQPARGRVERDTDAGDAAADHEHVELLVGQTAKCVSAVEVHPGKVTGPFRVPDRTWDTTCAWR